MIYKRTNVCECMLYCVYCTYVLQCVMDDGLWMGQCTVDLRKFLRFIVCNLENVCKSSVCVLCMRVERVCACVRECVLDFD